MMTVILLIIKIPIMVIIIIIIFKKITVHIDIVRNMGTNGLVKRLQIICKNFVNPVR